MSDEQAGDSPRPSCQQATLSAPAHATLAPFWLRAGAMRTGGFGCQAGTYLLLAQDDDALGLDGMPGGQVLAGGPLLAILVRRPLAVPGGPRHADVVPGLVLQAQRQLGNLRKRSKSPVLGGVLGDPGVSPAPRRASAAPPWWRHPKF